MSLPGSGASDELPVGDDDSVHLELLDGPAAPDTPATVDLDAAVLAALAAVPLSRNQLRALLRVRNERLGPVLTRLAADGRLVRDHDRWARAERPAPASAAPSPGAPTRRPNDPFPFPTL